MARIAVLLAALALAAPATGAAAPTSQLSITYWPGGQGTGTPLRWTLRCGPAGGSLPRPATACARLAERRAPFAPPRSDQVCTEIYGGPQVAIVAGRYEGRRIWVKLQRRNGCEIARFQGLRFLVPAFTGGRT
jgi:hypothetical protein